jgi:hypothetical protein
MPSGMFYVSNYNILTLQILVGCSWHISDLKDSRGRYSALLNMYNLHGTRVQSPDVQDKHGVRIHVGDYKTKLKEGMIVELEVILKL